MKDIFCSKKLYMCCCRKNRLYNTHDKIFKTGEKQIKDDLNVFRMIQSIKKLKISVASLMKESNKKMKMKEVEAQYLDT